MLVQRERAALLFVLGVRGFHVDVGLEPPVALDSERVVEVLRRLVRVLGHEEVQNRIRTVEHVNLHSLVGLREPDLQVPHVVREVPALHGVQSRRFRGCADHERVERRLGERLPRLNHRRDDHRHDDLFILTHLALVELERRQREDASLVLHLERLQVRREQLARVRGRRFEERPDAAPEAVVGVVHVADVCACL